MALSKPNGKYKLKTVGMPLACEYLKNLGVDLVKPDRHLCRIIARLGYSKRNPAGEQETMEICHDIAVAYGMTDIEVDSILWQFCADGYFAQCTNTPDCSKCLVKNCAYKNQP
jgi:thermostable 8-oxoguanine DNA glycosylase